MKDAGVLVDRYVWSVTFIPTYSEGLRGLNDGEPQRRLVLTRGDSLSDVEGSLTGTLLDPKGADHVVNVDIQSAEYLGLAKQLDVGLRIGRVTTRLFEGLTEPALEISMLPEYFTLLVNRPSVLNPEQPASSVWWCAIEVLGPDVLRGVSAGEGDPPSYIRERL